MSDYVGTDTTGSYDNINIFRQFELGGVSNIMLTK